MRSPDGPQAVPFGKECRIAFKSKSGRRRSGAEGVEGGDGRRLIIWRGGMHGRTTIPVQSFPQRANTCIKSSLTLKQVHLSGFCILEWA